MPSLSRILLAIGLVGALIPAGLTTTVAQNNNCDDSFGNTEYIKQSTPLEGQLSASQMVYEVSERTGEADQAAEWTNGLDGYVYPLDCDPDPLYYWVDDETQAQDVDADYAVEFYDRDFDQIGETVYETDDNTNAQLAGEVPDNAEFVVVLVEQAPLISGFAIENGEPTPYAAEVNLEFDIKPNR